MDYLLSKQVGMIRGWYLAMVVDRRGVPLTRQFERRASVKPAPSQSANLSRKALDSKRQNLEPRPERGAGHILLFVLLGGGRRVVVVQRPFSLR